MLLRDVVNAIPWLQSTTLSRKRPVDQEVGVVAEEEEACDRIVSRTTMACRHHQSVVRQVKDTTMLHKTSSTIPMVCLCSLEGHRTDLTCEETMDQGRHDRTNTMTEVTELSEKEATSKTMAGEIEVRLVDRETTAHHVTDQEDTQEVPIPTDLAMTGH